MAGRFDHLPNRRAIVDRRALAERIAAIDASDAALRQQATALLKAALAEGRDEIERRLATHPSRGLEASNAQAYLVDALLRILFDLATQRLHPLANPTAGERLTLIAVGGYGRAEMAPYSDVDIGFLTPGKQTPWAEQVIESMLYALWDTGLKIGHSSRSLDEMVRQAKGDVTIRTALLEARYVTGDVTLYDEAAKRFKAEVQHGTERQFIADKLAERDARHRKMGDTRYVVEPNVKAACATSTPCSGSASTSTTSSAAPIWSRSGC
jgi:[protein-PII] uridylyltransferase